MRTSNLRSLFDLSWPILIAQIAIILNGVADTVMVGHYQPTHLAAVGIGASIYVSINMGLSGILNALSPIIAQHFGGNRLEEIGRDVHQGLWAAILLGVVAIFLMYFPQPLLRIAQAPPEVEVLVREYLRNVAWGIPATMLARVFYSFTSAIGRSRPVMVINIIAMLCKIPSSYVLLHGMFGLAERGAPGCAIASSITAWLILLMSLSFALGDTAYRPFALFKQFELPQWRRLGSLFSLGIPIGLSQAIETTAFTFVALFLARFGAHVSSGHQIVANLTALLYMVPLSLGIGTSVLVAQAIGRSDFMEAQRMGRLSLRIMGVWSLGIGILLLIFQQQVIGIYTNDTAVAVIAGQLIVFIAIYQFFDAQQAVTVAILRGYKKTTIPMIIFVSSLWGIGLGGGYMLGLRPFDIPFGFLPQGAQGFWLAEVISIVVVVALVWIYFHSVSKRAISNNLASKSPIIFSTHPSALPPG